MTRIDESTFEREAGRTLQRLAERLEDADLEVDMAGSVLTLVTGGGTFVLNKHAPLRQLWLSSPVSGASHYDLEPAGTWRSTRGPATLTSTLAADLKTAAGVALDFG
jgi:frataxin